MDHLAMTKGFTLQHLRFLVIDEADRLLSSSFQNWLSQVLDQCRPHKPANSEELAGSQVALAWSEPMGLSRGDFEGSQVIPSSVSIAVPLRAMKLTISARSCCSRPR